MTKKYLKIDMDTGKHLAGSLEPDDLPAQTTPEDLRHVFTGSVTPGQKGHFYISKASRLTGAVVLAATPGDVSIDVRKTTFDNFPPSAGDSITNNNPITLTSGDKKKVDTSSWSPIIFSQDDCIELIVESASIQNVTVQLSFTTQTDGGVPLVYYTEDASFTDKSSATILIPEVYYTAPTVEEFPTYVAGTGVSALTPTVFFTSPDVEEFPIYIVGTGASSLIPTVVIGNADGIERYPSDNGDTEPPAVEIRMIESDSTEQFPENNGGTHIPTAPTIDSVTLNSAPQYEPWEQIFTATGVEPFIWNITGMPAGITFSQEGQAGKLSGRPTASAGSYTLTISVTDRDNQTVTDNSTYSISVTSNTQTPHVDLPVYAGSVGDSKALVGYNFGSTQGSSTFTINGTTQTVDSWSDEKIEFTIATGTTTGNVVVTVNSVSSNTPTFTIF